MEKAVLLGDYLFAKAGHLTASTENLRVIKSFIGVGSDTQMDSCPTLQVGETYLMDVNGRTLERDVPNTNKHAAWQVLELCNPAPSGCQQISTLRDRE